MSCHAVSNQKHRKAVSEDIEGGQKEDQLTKKLRSAETETPTIRRGAKRSFMSVTLQLGGAQGIWLDWIPPCVSWFGASRNGLWIGVQPDGIQFGSKI